MYNWTGFGMVFGFRLFPFNSTTSQGERFYWIWKLAFSRFSQQFFVPLWQRLQKSARRQWSPLLTWTEQSSGLSLLLIVNLISAHPAPPRIAAVMHAAVMATLQESTFHRLCKNWMHMAIGFITPAGRAPVILFKAGSTIPDIRFRTVPTGWKPIAHSTIQTAATKQLQYTAITATSNTQAAEPALTG